MAKETKLPSGGGDKTSGEWTEHLDELRRRIIAVLAVFVIATIPAFVFSEYLANFLMLPVRGLGVMLHTFNPAEKFIAYLNLAIGAGALFTAPFCLLQVGLFVWPALRGRERYWTAASLAAVPVLFIAGAAASYRFLSPVVLKFFLNFGGTEGIQAIWGFREYLSMLFALMLAAGLLLQTPLILLIAFVTGLVKPKTVARFRPHIAVLIFLAAALCTPPDVISQIALGVPLYLLFELTLFLGRIFTRVKKT